MSFHFDPQYISQRLGEVGPETENLSVIVQDDDSTWTLAFENEATVLILVEWAEEPARLVLSADIGTPPQSRAAQVHKTALSYNTLWRDTGGARIGMAGEEGDLLLVRELAPGSVQGDSAFSSNLPWLRSGGKATSPAKKSPFPHQPLLWRRWQREFKEKTNG